MFGFKKMKERIEHLEDRVDKLEHRPYQIYYGLGDGGLFGMFWQDRFIDNSDAIKLILNHLNLKIEKGDSVQLIKKKEEKK